MGWRQAYAVAGWLAQRYRPDLLLSSASIRAQQTAEVIAAHLKLPIVTEEGLEEPEFQYWSELPLNWETPMDSWQDLWQPSPDTSPLYASFRTRLHDGLARTVKGRANATILAVTHGGTIGTLMRSLFGGHHVAVFTANTGVSQFTWEVNHWRLVFHNCTAHLDALTPSRSAPPAAAQALGHLTNSQNASLTLQSNRHAEGGMPSRRTLLSERELRDMIRFVEPIGGERVIDVATGGGAVALAFAPHVASVLGVDLSPAMLERAEAARSARELANVHFSLGEIGALPLPEAFFDIVTCRDLLHYTTDVAGFLALLARLLKPDGQLLIDEPLGSEDPVKRATLNAIVLRRDPTVTQIWSASEIETALGDSGLRIRRSERYALNRELDEWFALAAADDATRSTVRSMIEAGLSADAAGLNARRGRDGNIILTESRIRLLAEVLEQPV